MAYLHIPVYKLKKKTKKNAEILNTKLNNPFVGFTASAFSTSRFIRCDTALHPNITRQIKRDGERLSPSHCDFICNPIFSSYSKTSVGLKIICPSLT